MGTEAWVKCFESPLLSQPCDVCVYEDYANTLLFSLEKYFLVVFLSSDLSFFSDKITVTLLFPHSFSFAL